MSKKRSEGEHQFITLLGKYRKAGYTSETEESMRNGRRVIAIYVEYKRIIPGIIHDTSTTGKTVYLEAEQLIPINNAITGLEEEERHEIQRILKSLTKELQGYRYRINEYYNILLQFDFIQAKARYATDINASLPVIVNDPQIDVKQAVHPLLYWQNKKIKKQTIPFSLYLKNKNRILVISGPNAGGKTVCMKTVALLQLMLQSGFLVSCEPESTFGIFSKLMIDIGDSQSIEYELSTYSSRLQKMRDFLQYADAGSLFIIDELGTGTDPQLGGALAEAILEKLNEYKCIGIVTTHFLNLKILADKTEGLINGNMLFDPEKLEPRYKLTVGKPGSSYTFLVAERSGLDKIIIENARKKIPKQNVLLENMLREVEEQKNYVDRKAKEISDAEKALDELLEKYNKLLEQGETGRKQFEQRIKEAELTLVKKFDALIVKFVNEWKSTKDKKAVLQKYQRLFGQQKTEIKKTETKAEAVLNKKYLDMLKPGLRVLLKGGRVAGTIESMEGNKVVVIFNGFKTSCLAQNLVPETEVNVSGKGKN
ncbi:MAG: DNA mismatch repair protein MutS [Bacteroidetes bacterium]|nr:DNA mismatch repair protein MutS [Bacteroidota bacterium]